MLELMRHELRQPGRAKCEGCYWTGCREASAGGHTWTVSICEHPENKRGGAVDPCPMLEEL